MLNFNENDKYSILGYKYWTLWIETETYYNFRQWTKAERV